jgi:predicted TIM-barrel fold metal-dependent hydrolase
MVIDVHTHIYTRPYIEALAARSEIPMVEQRADGEHFVIFEREAELLGGTRPMSTAFYTIEEKLRFMEGAGIDRSVVSLGNPWLDFFGPEESVDWARSINEELAGLATGNPALEALGVLPLQNPDAAVSEVAYLAQGRRLRGVVVGTRPGQRHLDAPELEPVWTALERAQLPVFLHPHYCVGYDWMTGYGHALPLALAFPFETTAAAIRLVLSGVLDRHPELQIMLAHGGGTLPYLAGRLAKCVSVDSVSNRSIKRPLGEYLRMFYYDALTYVPGPLRCVLDLAGPDRILFGTDHPFGIADPSQGLDAIDEALASHPDREAVRAGNALRWLESGHL